MFASKKPAAEPQRLDSCAAGGDGAPPSGEDDASKWRDELVEYSFECKARHCYEIMSNIVINKEADWSGSTREVSTSDLAERHLRAALVIALFDILVQVRCMCGPTCALCYGAHLHGWWCCSCNSPLWILARPRCRRGACKHS